MRVALYPGSFDPITLGHLDILERASKLFDRVIIAVANNTTKQPFIALGKRLELIREATQHLANVEVSHFEGLTVQFAKSCQAAVLIRGLRAVSDFEHEFQMFHMNQTLEKSLDSVILMASGPFQFLSSSLVREVAKFKGDISHAVPPNVAHYLNHEHPF